VIAPVVGSFPCERANDALEHLCSGKARYRVVLINDFKYRATTTTEARMNATNSPTKSKSIKNDTDKKEGGEHKRFEHDGECLDLSQRSKTRESDEESRSKALF